MANSLLTISMITREAVPIFVNSNAFIKNIDRQYDAEFGKQGEKIGNALRIRLPNDYTVRQGPGMSIQDTSEQSITLTMSTQSGVDVAFTSADLLLSIDDFSERVLLPMVNALAGSVASTVMTTSEGTISNIVANVDAGNNILNPNQSTVLQAGARLNDNSAPTPKRRLIYDQDTEARMVASLAGLLNPQSAIGDQYYEGSMYRAMNFTWFMDQSVIKHTAGTFTAGTVNGANQTGTAIVTNAITGTLVAGDIITFAGVNAVNRVLKTTTGRLKQFVIVTSAANGATSLTIYPSLIPASGGNPVQYQTVTASPANGAAISLFTNASVTYRKNFVYAPQAVTMATGDLPLYEAGVINSARSRYDNISMRMLTAYLPGSDQAATRLDVLYGVCWPRGEWATVFCDSV